MKRTVLNARSALKWLSPAIGLFCIALLLSSACGREIPLNTDSDGSVTSGGEVTSSTSDGGKTDSPGSNPDQPGSNPDQPGSNPDQPGSNPDQPGTNPDQPGTNPDQPGTNPDQPGSNPDQPGSNPDQPGTNPDQPGTNPDQPGTRPDGGQAGDACKSPCDCKQGLDCQSGKCVKASLPIYCCDKPGCPEGEACLIPSGQRSKCTKGPICVTHCDCQQGMACYQGQCTKAGQPIYCCEKKGCPSGSYCYKRNGSSSTCPGSSGSPNKCKHTCDCPAGLICLNGTCLKSSYPTYCCDKKGADCPSGKSCQWRVGGYGNCPPTKTACKGACDCKFGEICYNGACVKSQSRVYCCTRDKAICPKGGTCDDPSGQTRLCGSYKICKTVCDCPSG